MPCGSILKQVSNAFSTCASPNCIESLLKDACRNNCDHAQLRLAILYMTGQRGVHRDTTAGLTLLTQAASNGNITAYYDLGMVYAYGQLGDKDYEKACDYFEKALKQGFVKAGYEIGLICEKITTEKYHIEAAARYYSLAAQTIPDAAYRLAYLTKCGIKGTESFVVEQLLQIAIDSNHSEAMLEKSKSSKPCDAFELIFRAAQLGNVDAWYKLGDCYLHGIGCSVDIAQARNAFHNGARMGHGLSTYMLGVIYSKSSYSIYNTEKAREYLNRAIEMGVKSAEIELSALRDQLQ